MEQLIASVEQKDETERLRKLYESGGNLTHLRLLIRALVDKQDYRQLANYAPILLKEGQHVDDYDLSQKALLAVDSINKLLLLAKDYPELHKLNDDFIATEGWAYFYLGKVMQARGIGANAGWSAGELQRPRAGHQQPRLNLETGAICKRSSLGRLVG